MASLHRHTVRGLEYLALALAVLASVILAGIVAVIFTSVMLRRFANTPVHVAEDAVGLMLSASLFLGLPLVTLRAQHVRVSIVAEALSPRFPSLVRMSAMFVGVVFFGWILLEAIPWFEFAWKRSLRTETARLLLYPWMATLPVSLGLTWLIFLVRLLGLMEAERHTSLEALPEIATATKDR